MMENKTEKIITALVQNSDIDAADIPKIKEHITQHSIGDDTTILLRIFSWIGVLITWVFLYLYLLKDDPLKDTTVLIKLIISLVIFIPCAILLERTMRGKQGVRGVVLLQFSIILMWIGKYYFCSVFQVTPPHMKIWESFGMILITGLTYPFFRQEIDRFVYPLFSLMFLFLNMMTDFTEPVLHDYLVKLMVLGEVCILIAIFFHQRTKYSLIPLAYAVAVSLMAQTTFHLLYGGSLHAKLLGSAITGGGLLMAIFLVNREKKALSLEQGLLITIGVACLIYFNVSEILLSMFLLTLGYARRENPLFWIGLVFLPVFIIIYYYQIEMTLLAKSFSLMGTGLILLAGKFYVDHRIINQTRHT